jgi:DNA modification methylase
MSSNDSFTGGLGMLPPQIIYRTPSSLRVTRHARQHSKRQIRQIAASIKAFGFLVPILIEEGGNVIVGNGRLAAAVFLQLNSIPTLLVTGLSEAQIRAFMIADNKITENAGWDRQALAAEFGALFELLPPIGLDLTITGFSTGEIDQILVDHEPSKVDPDDVVPPIEDVHVSQSGDHWQLGPHHILCGDARSTLDLDRLLNGTAIRMVITDGPYNVKIHGHVQGRGRIKHREFAFASGEMNEPQFIEFLEASFSNFVRTCVDGAIVFIFIDWRHIGELLKAAKPNFTEFKNLIVWNKTSPGQGTFYRSQHELIGVFKVGTAEHTNTFGLGQNGRTRSNIWTYPGANSFRAGRMDDLAMHPTVKPIALIVDAMRDCSMKGDAILDVFLGSGTTIMAAEKIGRRGFGIEYDPAYVDVAVRRWQAYTRSDAVLVGDGRTFDEIAEERLKSFQARPPVPENLNSANS